MMPIKKKGPSKADPKKIMSMSQVLREAEEDEKALQERNKLQSFLVHPKNQCFGGVGLFLIGASLFILGIALAWQVVSLVLMIIGGIIGLSGGVMALYGGFKWSIQKSEETSLKNEGSVDGDQKASPSPDQTTFENNDENNDENESENAFEEEKTVQYRSQVKTKRYTAFTILSFFKVLYKDVVKKNQQGLFLEAYYDKKVKFTRKEISAEGTGYAIKISATQKTKGIMQAIYHRLTVLGSQYHIVMPNSKETTVKDFLKVCNATYSYDKDNENIDTDIILSKSSAEIWMRSDFLLWMKKTVAVKVDRSVHRKFEKYSDSIIKTGKNNQQGSGSVKSHELNKRRQPTPVSHSNQYDINFDNLSQVYSDDMQLTDDEGEKKEHKRGQSDISVEMTTLRSSIE